MQFNSLAFLVFFAIVFPLYCVLSFRWQNRMLLAASYLFYGWAEPRFVCLMALTTVIDFFIGIKIGDSTDKPVRKHWLVASIVMNLTMLGIFKYYDFFATTIADNLALIGIHLSPMLIRIGVPAGISFYTFHEISYTVDVYRGHIKPARSFEDFACFIAFFPQLVAGPIGRASWQMPQFEKPRRMTWDGWCQGALLMLFGFFKKIVVADSMAPLAARAFKNPELCSGSLLLLGLYCFSIQIYADFSGYTDIARGLARIMGFELIENFNQPYFASNITDFWRRWHISLSTWLRDYLYIPLGGNRFGKFNTYRNLFLTMFLGGLWHGASWKFAIWGSLHGIYLAVHKYTMGDDVGATAGLPRSADAEGAAAGLPRSADAEGAAAGLPRSEGTAVSLRDKPAVAPVTLPGYSPARAPMQSSDSYPLRLGKILVTFHLVAFSWIFFSADSTSGAMQFLKGIFTRLLKSSSKGIKVDGHDVAHAFAAALLMLLVIDLPQFITRDHCVALKWPLRRRVLLFAVLFVWIVMMRGMENVPFIYFQF